MPKAIQRRRAEKAVRSFLAALGLDVDDPHLVDTPARVVAAWADTLIAGHRQDPVLALGETFPAPSKGAVIARHIPVLAMCPHHLLPMTGEATIAYYPKERIAGFGRLASAVDAVAHRLVLQEALTQQLAEALHRALDARATLVIVEAKHLCVAVTDPARQNTVFRTTAALGRGARALREELAPVPKPRRR